MEEKNIIINNYVSSLMNMVQSLNNVTVNFGDDESQNRAGIKTADIIMDSIRAQTVILQTALDEY